MPELKGFRVLNLAYGESYVIPDLTLDFGGRNTLILMPNGAGKTYLLSCFFQTILPGAFLQPRTVDDLFSKCTGTSHILAAFSVEDETVLLGFSTRKKADRTYFNWILRLEGLFDIERLPIRRGESVLDYEELPLLMRSLYGDRFNAFRREDLTAYEQQLGEFGLGSEEWCLILSFNQFLEGMLPLQEVLGNTSDKILDPMVFPLIEKRLKIEGTDLRERISTFFSHRRMWKPNRGVDLDVALKDRLQSRMTLLRAYHEAKEDLRDAVCSLRTIQAYTHKEIQKAHTDIQRMEEQLCGLDEAQADCRRKNWLRVHRERALEKAELEKTEAALSGEIEEKQQKIALLYETLRRRMAAEADEKPSGESTSAMSQMQSNASVSWALMTKHHLETLLETVKSGQIRRETILQSSWETLSILQRCSSLQERYKRLGEMPGYQKTGYEKERAISALERNQRRQAIQKAVRRKLRQKLEGYEGDRESLKSKLAEEDPRGEQIRAYQDFVELLKSLDGNRPLPFIKERLDEKRNRLHIQIYEASREIERIDQLETSQADSIGSRTPEEVEKLASVLARNGFLGFEKGSDWIKSGKSRNPFLTFALITEYPLEMDQALSCLPLEDFPTLPIPVLSVREAETLVEASEYRTMMRLKLRWVPSLTEHALQLRLNPGRPASEENTRGYREDLTQWLQTRRVVFRDRKDSLVAALKKTEDQLERLAIFSQTLGPDPETADERCREKRAFLEKGFRLVSKSLDDVREKIQASVALSHSLGEEERILRQKIEALEKEEREWSLLSFEIEQVCGVPLKDFSLFCLSIQKRLSEWETQVQDTDREMEDALEELKNPLLSLVAREPQTDPSVFEAHPGLLWEIIAEIRNLESKLPNLFDERATLCARKRALPELDPILSPSADGAGDFEDERVSEGVESAETLERRIREIEESREETTRSIAEKENALRRLGSLARRQQITLSDCDDGDKKYIPGLARIFLKNDLDNLWEEKEAEYRKHLYAVERQRQVLDNEWVELKKTLDPAENWEEPVFDASEEDGLEGGNKVVTHLLNGLRKKISDEQSEERRTQTALSRFSKEIGSVMEIVNAHLRDIARFSRPGPEDTPLLEFSFPRRAREDDLERFANRIADTLDRQGSERQDVLLRWPLRTLWEFYFDQRLEIRISKPPFIRAMDEKYAWKDVEKWSTGEKMAIYLMLYASLFSWWKGYAPRSNTSSILVLDHLFGHINTETLLEIPMRMLYTHQFQIIGFTSSAEPFLFKYFPKWIGLSPQETDRYNFFLPFHVER